MMIAVPDVTIVERDNVNDQFLIIGCDGCWDCTPNEVVCLFLFCGLLLTSKCLDVGNAVHVVLRRSRLTQDFKSYNSTQLTKITR